MSKRGFLGSAAAGIAGLFVASCRSGAAAAATGRFEIELTEAEWRTRLSPAQFKVLREAGTERSGSSPLDKIYEAGAYACAGCDLPVYSSAAKFDSRTGWPSFTATIANAIRTRPDPGLFGTRTEVHCRRCGGHLGHVFDDGPPPTGQRWCMNGVAMKFIPA